MEEHNDSDLRADGSPLEKGVYITSDDTASKLRAQKSCGIPMEAALAADMLNHLQRFGVPSGQPFLEQPEISANQARNGKTSSCQGGYASRHQQAEARRRLRINSRLDALRRLIPNTERLNTAEFLEEAVKYILWLQSRVYDLEQKTSLSAGMSEPENLNLSFSAKSEHELANATRPNSDNVAVHSIQLPCASQHKHSPSASRRACSDALPTQSEELAMAEDLLPPPQKKPKDHKSINESNTPMCA